MQNENNGIKAGNGKFKIDLLVKVNHINKVMTIINRALIIRIFQYFFTLNAFLKNKKMNNGVITLIKKSNGSCRILNLKGTNLALPSFDFMRCGLTLETIT